MDNFICRQGNAQVVGGDEMVSGQTQSVVNEQVPSKSPFLWNILQFLISLFHRNNVRFSNLIGKHSIKGSIITYSASIFFIEEPKSHVPLCLKMWRFRDDGVYDVTTAEKRTSYIMDGLWFNQRFAPDIYLGVARINSLNEQYIVIEKFIEKPELKKLLSSGKEHALVMKRLPDDWRLDIQLEKGLVDTPPILKFLAQEVVRMHKKVEISSLEEMGNVASLWEKLCANVALLDRINCVQDKKERNKCIAVQLLKAFKANEERFEERWREGYIKRCHGDLKSGNLWLPPTHEMQPEQLLALDCIDFNRPEFCHIDTLCDVAMLAINLELSFTLRLGEERGQELIKYFFTVYLKKAGEDMEKTSFLLDYYMAEKAIVCAYTSHVYDHLPLVVVDKYLDLALMHVEKLKAGYSCVSLSNRQSAEVTKGLAPI